MKKYEIKARKEASAQLYTIIIQLPRFIIILVYSLAVFFIFLSYSLSQDVGKPELYGGWDTVLPEDDGAAIGQSLGMQSVHSVFEKAYIYTNVSLR
jgi:hypothetical protein